MEELIEVKKHWLEYKMPVKLMSHKAAMILDSCFLQKIAHDTAELCGLELYRNAEGEVRVKSVCRSACFENALKTVGKRILKEAAQPGKRNTVKTRAEDKRSWKSFEMRDLSLLGYILRGSSRKQLEKSFGKEAVEEMTGNAENPLEVVRRTIVLDHIDGTYEQMFAASEPETNKFNSVPFSSLQGREVKDHLERMQAIEAPFKKKISELFKSLI